MRGRGQAIIRALGALMLLAALVIGVPILLVTLVGNPFPSEIPSIDEVRVLLTQNGDGFTNFVLGVLATLVWLVWAQLVIALIAEITATIRQAETRRMPVLPGLQAFVARLIAMVTLTATLTAGPMLAPAVGALTFSDPVSTVAEPAVTLGSATSSVIEAPTTGAHLNVTLGQAHAVERTTSLVVHDHTELWDLADAAYGDGVSWKLIALTNAGLIDAEGAMITGDSETVAPGTELLLPGSIDAEAAAAFGMIGPGGDDPSVTNGVHVVEPGDSMWTIAEAEVERKLDAPASTAEIADYWVDVVNANNDVRSGDVDLIYPGERLVLPLSEGAGSDQVPTAAKRVPAETDSTADRPMAEPPPVEEGERATDPTETPAISASDREEQDTPDAEVESAVAPEPANRAGATEEAEGVERGGAGSGLSGPAVGLTAFGAAVLSAGIVGAVRRRRDLQRRTRPSHAVARTASTDAAAFEAALIHASNDVRTNRQGRGWTLLPAAAVHSMRQSGPLEIHANEDGGVAAVMTRKADTIWQAERIEFDSIATSEFEIDPEAGPDVAVDTANPAATPTAPPSLDAPSQAAPTSIVVGTNAATNEAVFLDLASVGVVALEGEVEAIRRFARSAILDLAVSERADDLRVIAVGAGAELDGLERVRCVGTFEEAHAAVIRSGHAGADSSTPVIVLAGVSSEEVDDSLRAIRDLGAVIVAPGIDAEVSISINGDRAVISPSGTEAVLAALDDADYRRVAELIDTTGPAAMQLADASATVENVLDVSPGTACLAEPGPIDVKVLGPVEIAGADSFSSLKAVDVVSYLAFHRHGVDADQIKTWVWPAFDPPTDKAFANVMSRARTGLGVDEEGAPYLSRAGADKTYRLAEAVTTDFDRFRAIVDAANEAPDTATTLALLRTALELIRGVPFTGGAASSFTWADNHVRAQVEFTIDETVHRCADLALEIGDLTTARWAALKGLELVPGCEQCFKRRFLVAGAGNNRSELRRAMADLEASAAAELGEPEAVDTISGELLDLYNELDRALVAGTV